jgi:DNA-binding winged helix-turn-helix (wHTH) protein/tetratricopeptide (TPR) repeat protein
MYESTEDDMSTHGIDLAREPDFDLGAFRVHPAKCEVEWEGAAQTLQRRVMQVLVALAQSRGSVVSQDELVRRCWRGLSVSDDAIFRCISKLRKLAAGYPDAPFSIETIPGVGYRLTSSSSVDDDSAAETAASQRRRSGLRALAAVAVLAILALVASMIWIERGNAPAHSIRVTVQPFEALSNSADVRLLARRIPNEVVDALGDSQIEAALGGQQADKVGQSGLIVTGIVRDDSSNADVDVRIEDSVTHAALWSTEFKRDSGQASDLPVEVAARVTDMVNMVAFARSANPPLTDNSALSALLQTSDMIRENRDELWAQIIQHAQDLVTRHPEFAFGHSLLATAYGDAAEVVAVPDRVRAMRDAARREANLTLKLDPQDAGAYLVLSQLEPAHDYRAQEAILLRGIKFAKHPKEPLGALYQYENGLLDNVGRLQEGLSYQMVAQATDQWSPSKTSRLAFVYANMGNLAAAKTWIQKGMERWPNHSSVLGLQRYIAGFYQEPPEALAVFDRLDAQGSPGDDQNATWRTFIEARAAHSGQVTATAIERIRAAADQGKISREIEIMMIAGLGDAKQAIEAANLALDHQNLEPRLFLFAPITRNMRQDPGFLPLASRMGLINYWRQTGKWPDFCTDQASRAECTPELQAGLKSRV